MALFIGGTVDGQNIDVPELQIEVRIPVPDKMMLDARGNPTVAYEEYRRESIRGEKKLFDVFVLRQMSVDKMFERLLNCYEEIAIQECEKSIQ